MCFAVRLFTILLLACLLGLSTGPVYWACLLGLSTGHVHRPSRRGAGGVHRPRSRRARPGSVAPTSFGPVPKLPPAARPGQVRVAPSILSADYARLAEEIASVRAEADLLHVDVMDAHFVPNITIGPPVVAWVRRHTDLYLDCHLMMDNPGQYLEAFRDAGADGCSVHVEVGQTAGLISQMRDLGLGAGLAVNPETPFEDFEPWLAELDLLLVMTVHPGFGGQSFIGETVPKLARARSAVEEAGLSVDIQVDGGIDAVTAPVAVGAGARILVAGSAVFGQSDRLEAARRIREAGEAAGRPPSGGALPGPGAGR
jgi:ribulose-phosphate 3-epimerase